MVERPMALSFVEPITLALSLLQRMASNDDNKRKMEEEVESLMVRKRLQLPDDNSDDNDSFESLEEEPELEEEEETEEKETQEEEEKEEETSMN
jgi:outer membrane biosynthesis protein TonB